MNKTLLAIATAMLAATALFASAAEAGGLKVRLGFGGPLPYFTAHGNSGGYHEPRHRRHHYVRRKVKSKVHVTEETPAAETSDVTKVESEAQPAKKAAVNENSSISTAALPKAEETTDETAKAAAETTDTATVDTPKAGKKIDCKKFFPSVGMTLSVPCE